LGLSSGGGLHDSCPDRTQIRVGIIERVANDATEARALQTLGLLTRGALHQISNPLVGLVGSAELALSDTEPGTKLSSRIELTHRTGLEIAEIVRALQAFIRLQDEPERELSLGDAAADAIALVLKVLPVHDTTFRVSGDATIVASPGETQRRLVEFLVDELRSTEHGATIELEARDGVVTAGGRELRF
jgi:signal transduction histidine kinase